MSRVLGERADRGVHLVGSIPLSTPDEVFAEVAAAFADRIERIPDGETGSRSDWIVWQYPVLSARPEFEVCPPGEHPYRSLPRLRLRDGAPGSATLHFGELGYARAAQASYRAFAAAKRDGVVPAHCRFQVCLPTPLSPVTAFVAPEHRALVEPAYEAAMAREVAQLLAAIPHDQLALQWDANFEFAMIDGLLPCWFDDPRAGVVERLQRLAELVPADVELGFHFCHDHDRLRHDAPYDARRMVEIANALSAVLARPLNWLHLPVPSGRLDVTFFEKLAPLSLRPETELYLGLVHLGEGQMGLDARITAARRYLKRFGIATECGWGRHRPGDITELARLHCQSSSATHPTQSRRGAFAWPDGCTPIPAETWTTEPPDDAGLAYDAVDRHSWYGNLDQTVADVAAVLHDGDIVVDYSGGTGILVDRLKWRAPGTAFGTLIVDSSPAYLRVAIDKFRGDPSVGVRWLRNLRDEGRLQRAEEVLEAPLLARGVDVITCANSIHLYDDLPDVIGSWRRILRPGGTLLINSGNIRNPRAGANEWIPDETVWSVADLAEGIVRSDARYAAYRPLLEDKVRLKAHAARRDKIFLAPRPLDHYLEALRSGGFTVSSVHEAPVSTGVDDWFEFLTPHHGAVLGWFGGTVDVDGNEPSASVVTDRLQLMREAIDMLFAQRPSFQACWTYITCTSDSVAVDAVAADGGVRGSQ